MSGTAQCSHPAFANVPTSKLVALHSALRRQLQKRAKPLTDAEWDLAEFLGRVDTEIQQRRRYE
jgi:hypothetical protein